MQTRALFFSFLILALLPISACKAEEENFNDYRIRWCGTGTTDAPTIRNPVFDNIKKVNILLRSIHVNEKSGAHEALLPENLGPFIQRLYKARFEEWQPPEEDGRNNIGCYGRNNQPVNLFYADNKQDSEKVERESTDPSILTVHIKVMNTPSRFYGLSESEDFITIAINNYRSNIWDRESLFIPVVIPLKSSDVETKDIIGKSLASQLKDKW